MGHFSWNCKHCDRPIQDQSSTWRGLNEWMTFAVVLFPSGSRVMGEYDGYGNIGSMNVVDEEEGAWAHQACWRKAGKPDFEDYGSPSEGCQHGGYEEKDLIREPGNEPSDEEWTAALKERADTLRRAEVEDAVKSANNEQGYGNAWEGRFGCYKSDGKGMAGVVEPHAPGWIAYDRKASWGGYGLLPHEVKGLGSEADAHAWIQVRWDLWMASEDLVEMRGERKAYLDRLGHEREQRMLEMDDEEGDRYRVWSPLADQTGYAIYDRCDYGGEDTDEFMAYVRAGIATEEEAQRQADFLNAHWRKDPQLHNQSTIHRTGSLLPIK